MDFVKAGEERDGDKDDDCFFAVADFELWGGGRDLVSLCTANSDNRRAHLWFDGHRSSRRAIRRANAQRPIGSPMRAERRRWKTSYLTGRNELQRPQRALHVRDVGFQIVEGTRDAVLELRRFLPRWTGRCNLVEGSHDCGRGVGAVLGLRFRLGSRFCVGVYFPCKAE